MKKNSPNNFLGGLTAGIVGGRGSGGTLDRFLNSSLGRAAQQAAGPSQAQQAAAASSMAGGVMDTAAQNPMFAGAVVPEASINSGVDPVLAGAVVTGGDMDQANPFEGKTFQITPTTPANMKGNAKPVFNENTSNTAAMMYGTPEQRQMSMGQQAPVFMKDQTGDGKITQADVIKARIEGYKE